MRCSPQGPQQTGRTQDHQQGDGCKPPLRNSRLQAPSRIISTPSPTLMQKDQNITATGRRSSRGNSFSPENWQSQLCVRIRLPRRGISIAKRFSSRSDDPARSIRYDPT